MLLLRPPGLLGQPPVPASEQRGIPTMTDDPNSIAGRVARGMDYGPAPSRSVVRRIAIQDAALVQRLIEAAEAVIKETAHNGDCQFAGCSCGAATRMAEARAEFYRLLRRFRP